MTSDEKEPEDDSSVEDMLNICKKILDEIEKGPNDRDPVE